MISFHEQHRFKKCFVLGQMLILFCRHSFYCLKENEHSFESPSLLLKYGYHIWGKRSDFCSYKDYFF